MHRYERKFVGVPFADHYSQGVFDALADHVVYFSTMWENAGIDAVEDPSHWIEWDGLQRPAAGPQLYHIRIIFEATPLPIEQSDERWQALQDAYYREYVLKGEP